MRFFLRLLDSHEFSSDLANQSLLNTYSFTYDGLIRLLTATDADVAIRYNTTTIVAPIPPVYPDERDEWLGDAVTTSPPGFY